MKKSKIKNPRQNWDYVYHDNVDPTIEFFYTAHNLTLLAITVAILIYFAFTLDADAITNTKAALIIMSFVIIIFGIIQFRDGPFIRPHPAVWRAVLGLGLIYQLILVFILFQSKDQVRYLLSFLDPTLGVPLPEKSYAEDCSLTWSNVYSQMDVFVWVHTFGWVFKALILRDYWICWIISILFELMEYSLEHQLPNFAECWWDHWVMDVLVTNWIGIYVGMKLCEFFKFKTYSWRGIGELKTIREKLSRTVAQFTPHSWTSFDWALTKTPVNFFAALALIYLDLQCELNAFYLKTLLWIPVSNPLNVYRLLFFFLACLPATRELYQYVSDPKCTRLGAHAWLTTINILTEVLIIIKFSQGEFTEPTPTHIIAFWSTACILLVTFILYKFN